MEAVERILRVKDVTTRVGLSRSSVCHWYDSVKPGDLVVADPLWNETTAVRYRRLPPVSEVLNVERGRGCQTGVKLSVRSLTGWTMQIDAGWFRPHETAQETEVEK